MRIIRAILLLWVSIATLSGGCSEESGRIAVEVICQCKGQGGAPKATINPPGSTAERVIEPISGKYPGPCSANSVERYWDGTLSESNFYKYKYDEKGRLTTVFRGGTISREYAYDSVGNVTMVVWYGAAPLGWARYYYNRKCEYVLKESDYDADGTVDAIVRNQFDDKCHKTLREYDDDGNGTVDDRLSYTYDDQGNLVLIQEDEDLDGVPDATANRYAYDAAGNKVLEEWFGDSGQFKGQLIQRVTWAYDKYGRLVLQEVDRGGDGTIDYSTQFYYDESGNPVDENGVPIDDGKEYDADGHLLSEEYDGDKTVYDYSCWEKDEKGEYVDTRQWTDGVVPTTNVRLRSFYPQSSATTEIEVPTCGDVDEAP